MSYNPNNCPLLIEYEKLKEEQLARVGFRDNLIFLTLGAFGGISTFASGTDAQVYSLLVVPWVSSVLGWTYLANDQKISAISAYVRGVLSARVSEAYPQQGPYFGWEEALRQVSYRRRAKVAQLAIDIFTFCCTSLVSLGVFLVLVPDCNRPLKSLVFLEAIIAIWMAYEITAHSRRGVRNESSPVDSNSI